MSDPQRSPPLEQFIANVRAVYQRKVNLDGMEDAVLWELDLTFPEGEDMETLAELRRSTTL
jgi:hypothetical protein